jgi:hypothetical protein
MTSSLPGGTFLKFSPTYLNMESFEERNDKMAADILKFPLLLLRLACPRGFPPPGGNDLKMITLEIISTVKNCLFLQA